MVSESKKISSQDILPYEENLDYFRGLFALIVLFAHLNQIFLLPIYYSENNADVVFIVHFIGGLAAYSVVGFVLISGYVITRSLHLNSLKNIGKISYKTFLLSRIKRLYPPLILALVIGVLVVSLIKGFNLHGAESFRLFPTEYVARETVSYDWLSLFLNLFFLPEVINNIHVVSINAPLWSLNFEFFFYLLLMSIAMLFFEKSYSFILTIVFLLGFLYYQVIYVDAVNYLFLYFFLIFLVGSFAYMIHDYTTYNFKKMNKYWFLYTFFLINLVLYINNFDYSLTPYQSLDSYNTMLIVAILMVLIYSVSLSCRSLPLKKFFVKFSKFSFTLYVVHFPLLIFAFSLFHEFIVLNESFLITGILSIFVGFTVVKISSLLSRLVERKNYANE